MSVVAYSIGKANRKDASVNQTAVRNPGPGTYEKTGSPFKNPPKWGVGSAQRSQMENLNVRANPGPGNYQLPSKVGEGPKYVMGAKEGQITIFGKNQTPGPGAYQPQDVTKTDIRYSMAMKTKVATSIIANPEGGHARLSQSVDFAPGPGAYQAKPVYKKVNTGPRFGTDKRQGLASARAGAQPGPSAYNENSKDVVIKKAPAFGFGTSKRPQSHNARSLAPGPGAYAMRGITGTDTQGKTLAQRLGSSLTPNQKNPGPGSYQASYGQALRASPGWKIGSSKRDEREKINRRTCNYPPPNSYNANFQVQKEKYASWSFGTGKRKPLNNAKTVPAPGAYNINNKSVEGPNFSMGMKLENQSAIGQNIRKTKANPGPGVYQPDFFKTVKSLPAYSLKSRAKGETPSKTPGPGAYDKVTPEKKRGPTYAFGTASQRQKQAPATAPGPGMYHIPCSITEMPQYTAARSNEFGYI